MKFKTEKIYGDVTPKSVEEILLNKLPSNSWLIDEEIKFVKQLNGYISINEDLENVKELIAELSEIREREKQNNIEERRLIKRALFTNAIVTYARCFNFTKKDGRNSIDITLIKKDFPTQKEFEINDLIRFHKYIMEYRNTFISHADKNIYETDKAHIEFEYDGQTLNSIFSHYSIKVFSFDEVQLKNFSILTNVLLLKVDQKRRLLIEKVKNEIGNEKLLEIGLGISKKN
ncbi:hypothetical protein LPB03_16355 [Polaribacter vadi]|uniref:Uncharacterized protein n=1 Tax=Polaribacter vadi TaxID=1774273 RepID=A0A1B8TNZ7_9FLAO|nr:hypothetical protein [Polaribacter vadi]AOW18926.1 hypothetical protein LPB03_16355 [Polaribacter vadi]OBY61371.1 hypothetical protein LPB3_16295 [Polaribacter vadi]|tara:strand:+ start:168 stop:860 length:693 start_codon:yes stop_codon:yes gene_type:complete